MLMSGLKGLNEMERTAGILPHASVQSCPVGIVWCSNQSVSQKTVFLLVVGAETVRVGRIIYSEDHSHQK